MLCSIYRVDGEQKTLLGQEKMESCKILPKDRVCVKTEIIIPYRTYLFAGPLKILPDWIVLTIDGHFSLAGTRQEFPISLNAYVDPTVIREKENL